MSVKSIFCYGLLFFILLLLTAAHPIFVLIFFLAIITIIVHKVKQKKKSKVGYSRTYPQNYFPPKLSNVSNQKNHHPTNNQNDASHISNKSNYTKIISGSDQTKKLTSFDNSQITNQKEQKLQESFEKNYDKIIQKKPFNHTYWNFHYNEGIENKKHKFFEAINLCEQNNIGSKAKIRRLKMKLERWNVENERDIDALIPDYEHLLDLIEEFETR